MCKWPFFYGPGVPGALAPVQATDDMTQEVGVRNCKLYTKPTSGGGSSDVQHGKGKFTIGLDDISIDCTWEIVEDTVLIHLPGLTSIAASQAEFATITGLPNDLVIDSVVQVLTLWGGAALTYFVPIQCTKVANTAFTIYLYDDVTSLNYSTGTMKLSKSMYYLQYASGITLVLTKKE